MFHFSMAPLRWQAACGASNVLLTRELGLIECPACRSVVASAERRGLAS
jgi:hypothetical protein